MSIYKRIAWQKVGIPLAFLTLCISFTLSSDKFLTVRNLTNVARQISILAFLSYGMTLVIGNGGIDISVGNAGITHQHGHKRNDGLNWRS
jgi:ribose/xylose/arabinose/galactoside ABC-type transport system permease subunit